MCPSFAALCEKLFTSAVQLLGNRWHGASDKKKIDWLLNGISTADFQIKVRLFSACPVLYFTIKLLLLVAVCVFYFYLCFFLFILSLFLCASVCLIMTFICIFKIFNVNSVSSQDEPFRLLEQMVY